MALPITATLPTEGLQMLTPGRREPTRDADGSLPIEAEDVSGYPTYQAVFWRLGSPFRRDPATDEQIPDLVRVELNIGSEHAKPKTLPNGKPSPNEIDFTATLAAFWQRRMIRVDHVIGPAWEDAPRELGREPDHSITRQRVYEYAQRLKSVPALAQLIRMGWLPNPAAMPSMERDMQEHARQQRAKGYVIRPEDIAEGIQAHRQDQAEWKRLITEAVELVRTETAERTNSALKELIDLRQEADDARQSAEIARAEAELADERASKAEAEARRVQAEKAALEAKLAELDKLKADNAKLLKALAKADKQSGETKPADETTQPKQSDAGAPPPVEG